MFKSFTIGNFLSFKEKNVFSLQASAGDELKNSCFSFENQKFLKSSAIYGANASGKSNFLKALLFFRMFVLDGLKISLSGKPLSVEPFLFNTETENRPSVFEIEFLNKDERFVYGFEVNAQKIEKEWLHQYVTQKRVLFEREGQEFVKENKTHFKEMTKQAKDMTRENVLFISVLASLNGEIARRIVTEIQNLEIISGFEKGKTLDWSFNKFTHDNEYKDKMLEFVIESDFGIVNMTSQERRITVQDAIKNIPPQLRLLLLQGKGEGNFTERKISTIHKKFNKKNKECEDVAFDFFKESDGTQQMFALSGPFVDVLKSGKVLFIDEIDASLHPFLCRYILSIFNSKKHNPHNAQIVFTTHDISMLDNEIMRRDQVWFTEKDKYGATELFRLSTLSEKKDANFAKRYLDGRYGALPYIKSLESFNE